MWGSVKGMAFIGFIVVKAFKENPVVLEDQRTPAFGSNIEKFT